MWKSGIATSIVVILSIGSLACTEDTSDVLGASYFDFFLTGGRQPNDLSEFEFRAFVPDRGGFVSYPSVKGTSAGTFVIPQVQDGRFVLKTTSPDGVDIWEEYDTHNITEIIPVLGRPDAVSPAFMAPLSMHLDGAVAWESTDLLFASCWQNGTESSSVHTLLSPPPASGDTVFDGQFDWNRTTGVYSYGPSGRPYLMDGSLGDTLTISRVHVELGVSRIEYLTQVANGKAPTQVDGEVSSFSASFVPVTRDETISLTADLPAIAERIGSGTTGAWLVTVVRSPGAAKGLLLGPPLLSISGTDFDAPLNLQHDFGDPFDHAWPRVVYAQFVRERSVVVPGTTQEVKFSDGVFLTDSLVTSEQVLAPSLGPAGGITLNGIELAESGMVPWTGDSPVRISVALPPNVSGFDATLLAIMPEGFARVVARLRSLDGDLVLPPEALGVGGWYALVVTLAVRDGDRSELSQSYFGPFMLIAE